jgi:hypothetical protein
MMGPDNGPALPPGAVRYVSDFLRKRQRHALDQTVDSDIRKLQLMAGSRPAYTFLPLGLRALRKVEQIVARRWTAPARSRS